MKDDLRLNLNQVVRLSWTPEMRQALKILMTGSAELAGLIAQEAEENPVIEIGDADRESPATSDEGQENLEWLDYFQDASDTGYVPPEPLERQCDDIPSAGPSLREYLEHEVRMVAGDPDVLRAADFLIGCIDEDGYCRISPEEASVVTGVGRGRVDAAVRAIQSLEPTGVGAQSLGECLLIQLRAMGLEASLAAKVVGSCLPDLAKQDFKKIASSLGASVGEVKKAASVIKALDPRPGLNICPQGSPEYVIPDATIRDVGAGPDRKYAIVMNESSSPRLRLNPRYRAMLSRETLTEEERSYITSKIRRAVWLFRAVEQRRVTVYRILDAVLLCQRDFFRGGPDNLHPLTMAEVASTLGIHESTVSRAIANKHIETPFGVYPLRFFFSSGVSDEDQGRSKESVKRMIATIVSRESPGQPLSDGQICQALRADGLRISRRTVAKYRNEARIPPSTKRR